MKTSDLIRRGITLLIVSAAALAAWFTWQHYMYAPWTSDARVRAAIVRIAPEVSGRLTTVAVHDNQNVEAGDVLFVIDPQPYQLAVEKAKADLSQAQAKVASVDADEATSKAAIRASQVEVSKQTKHLQRREAIGDAISSEERADAHAAAAIAQAGLHKVEAMLKATQANKANALAVVRQAEVALAQAELALSRTQVKAPAHARVTNLDARVGDYAQTGQAQMALIADDSFWIYGYFEETKLRDIKVGAPVDIELMSSSSTLKGTVESISAGITDAASPTDNNLMANVQPTFNWIRLAQRIPVRVRIDPTSIPTGMQLSAGMSATLRVHPGDKPPRT